MKLDASNETGYGYDDGEAEEPSIVKSDGKHCIGSRAGSSGFECEGAETAKMVAAATDIDDGGGGAPLPARTVWGGRLVMGRTIGRAQNGKPIEESGSSSV